jgi:hypothetical protein
MADLSVCAGCGRPFDGDARWNVGYVQGRAVQALCPDCQTPDDTAEAEEHARTVDYAALKQYGSARLVTTLELQAANATAVEQDWIAFTDEAMEMLREYDHLLVLGGTAGDLGIAACACSVAPDETETADGRLILERVRRDRDAPIGMIEVRLADFMGWREVLIPADAARSMVESVQRYVLDTTQGEG